MLVEDKDARGADNGRFQFYEALVNVNYRVADNVHVGIEVFRKEGQDFNHNGTKTATSWNRNFALGLPGTWVKITSCLKWNHN